MLETVPQNVLNVILKIFLEKLLFKKTVIHFIGDIITLIKFRIFKTKTANL